MKAIVVTVALAFMSVGSLIAQDTIEEQTIQQIESLRRGEFATVLAEVIRITDDDEMIVRDNTGRLRIYVPGIPNLGRLVSVGELLTITGTVDDDWFGILPELYAESMVRGDGTQIELPRSRRWD
jgi:uncharacterized protein YdeI (BOF family)